MIAFALCRQLLETDSLPPPEGLRLLESARRLRRAATAPGARPLRGRHLAIAVDGPPSTSAFLFERAAAGLGARVSRIEAAGIAGADERAEHAARLLGSLYDAVDCIALPIPRVRALLTLVRVPVFADVCGPASPLRALLPMLQLEAATEDEGLLGLAQAVLVETVT